MPTDVPETITTNKDDPGRRSRIRNLYADMHRCLQMCPRTIGTGFTDNKDASRTIRTAFTDRFVVSHCTGEFQKDAFSWTKAI